MTGYRPEVLSLYCKALMGVAWLYVAVLAALLGGSGALIGHLLEEGRGLDAPPLMTMFTLIGFVGGGFLGWLVSYTLKVRAHRILLDMTIEDHLRALRSSAEAGQPPQTEYGAGDYAPRD